MPQADASEFHALIGWLVVVASVLYIFRRRLATLPITFYVGAVLWTIGVGFGMWHSIQSYPDLLREFGFGGAIEVPFYLLFLIISASIEIHQFLIYYSIHELDASHGLGDMSASGLGKWVGTWLERMIRFSVVLITYYLLLMLLCVGGEVPHRGNQLYEMFRAPLSSLHLSTPTAAAIACPATTAPTTTAPAANVATRNKDYMRWSIYLYIALLLWDIGAFAVANSGKILKGVISDLRILFTTHHATWDARQRFILSDFFGLLFFSTLYSGLNGLAPGWLLIVLVLSGSRYIYIIARRIKELDVSPSAKISTP